jgi:putative chitinase
LSNIKASNPSVNATALAAAADKWKINTIDRVECWLANVLLESGGLSVFNENMNYTTAQRLMEVWPSRFPTLTDAKPYVSQPQKLGDFVYASLGGYAYRGCGWPQLTGKDNFAAYSKASGVPLVNLRNYLNTPAGSADCAGWFFSTHGCAAYADKADLLSVRDVWEGMRAHTAGPQGWLTCLTWYNTLRGAFGRPAVPVAPAPIVESDADKLNDEQLKG